MAGFLAVAAGSLMPGIAGTTSAIFNKVASVMSQSAAQGTRGVPPSSSHSSVR
jgi:hypothetical protein